MRDPINMFGVFGVSFCHFIENVNQITNHDIYLKKLKKGIAFNQKKAYTVYM